MTEIGEIPEEWKTSSLAEVCYVIMGQSPPSETYNRDRVGLPFLQGRMDFGDIYPSPSVYCSKPIKIADEGDILVSVRAPVGDVNIATSKCCIGRGLAAIRSDKNQLDSKFIFYQLKHFSTKLAGLGSGSTFKAIRRRDLERLPTVHPPLPEQKKIASILSTMDEQIEKERAKKGQLEQLKKGLMQVLLTGKVRVKVN
jgi:type I restriction enzyme S subunit